MPDTAERLAALEVLVKGIDERTREDNKERQERHHRLANEFQKMIGGLRSIEIALVPLAELPARVKDLEDTSVSKDGLSTKLKAIGVDPEKPSDTARTLTFASELRETFSSTRKHALFVVVGLVTTGTGWAVWAALKGAHP